MVSKLAVVDQPIPHHPREKKSTAAPAVQPPSPRVHFSSTASIVTGVSRPLTSEEAWLLYDFETHCRACQHCQSPYRRWRAGASLCHHGNHLAKLVAETIYMQNEEVYERYTRHRKPMRVEIPHTYTYLREQLQVMEEMSIIRHSRREDKPKVRVHNDDQRRKDTHRRSDSTEVVIEAGHSAKHRRKEKYRHEEPRETKYHEHKHRDAEYRHEEKRGREYRRAAEAQVEINVKDKKYRTQERRPAWVDEEVKARR